MLKHIESLRKRPKNVRDRYALIIAVLCTGVIALIWATTLPSQLALQGDPELVASAQEDVSHFSEAFGNVFARAGDVINTVRSQRYEKAEPGPKIIDLAALVASSSLASTSEAFASSTATTTATTTASVTASTSATTTELNE